MSVDEKVSDYEDGSLKKQGQKKKGNDAPKRAKNTSKEPPVLNKMAQIIAERQARDQRAADAKKERDDADMTEKLKSASRSIVGVRAKDIFGLMKSTPAPVTKAIPKIAPLHHQQKQSASSITKKEEEKKEDVVKKTQSDLIALYAQKKREKDEKERQAEAAKQNQKLVEARLAETKKRQQAQAAELARIEEEKQKRLQFLEASRQQKRAEYAREVPSPCFATKQWRLLTDV